MHQITALRHEMLGINLSPEFLCFHSIMKQIGKKFLKIEGSQICATISFWKHLLHISLWDIMNSWDSRNTYINFTNYSNNLMRVPLVKLQISIALKLLHSSGVQQWLIKLESSEKNNFINGQFSLQESIGFIITSTHVL